MDGITFLIAGSLAFVTALITFRGMASDHRPVGQKLIISAVTGVMMMIFLVFILLGAGVIELDQ